MADTVSLERRRTQNRDAQRRFRQRQKNDPRNALQTFLSLGNAGLSQYEVPTPSSTQDRAPRDEGEGGGQGVGDGQPEDNLQDNLHRPPGGDHETPDTDSHSPPIPTHGGFWCERTAGYGSYSLLDNIVSINMNVTPDEVMELPLDRVLRKPSPPAAGHPAETMPFSLDGISVFGGSDTTSTYPSSSSSQHTMPQSVTSFNGTEPNRSVSGAESPAAGVANPKTVSVSLDGDLNPGSIVAPQGVTAARKTSALHVAAQKGHDRITRTLLQNGADCNLGDHQGRTPLMLAVIAGHKDVAALLLAGRARVDAVDHRRRSALHWAVAHRREALLSMLISYCTGDSAILDARDDRDETPLHIAVNDDFEPGVQVLLQGGASMML